MSIASAWLLLAAALVQEPAAEVPVFASGVTAVMLDVSAFDEDGRPVPDLRPEELVVSVDRQARRVVSAQFRAYGPAAAPARASEDGFPPFSSNEGPGRGRLIFLVVDQENLALGSTRILHSLADSLLAGLGPRDQVAVMTLPGPLTRLQLGPDHAKLRPALSSITGRSRPSSFRLTLSEAAALDGDTLTWRETLARECPRTTSSASSVVAKSCADSLEAEARSLMQSFRAEAASLVSGLRTLVGTLKQTPGRKALVLVTEGFGEQTASELNSLAEDAVAARITLQVALVEPSAGDPSVRRMQRYSGAERQLRTLAAERLASLAGGGLVRVLGDGQAAFSRIAAELSGDYLVGFEPEPGDRDGKTHQVRVECTRRGVSVRSRAAQRLPPPPREIRRHEDALLAALETHDQMGELPLKVATYALPERGGARTRVLIGSEIGRAGAAPRRAAVGFVVADETGAAIASGFEPPAGADHDAGRPLSFDASVSVPPGRYLLKLAALDDRGRVGTVVHPVRASLNYAGALETSDLVLGTTRAEGAPLPNVDPQVADGRLVGYLEIHARDELDLVNARVALEVTGRDSSSVLAASATELRAQQPGWGALQGALDVGALPPGDYVASAVVSLRGQAVRRLSRSFRIVGGSGAGASLRPIAFGDLAAALPRFDRREALRPELVGPFLDRLERLTAGQAAAALARERLAAGQLGRLAELDGDGRSLGVAFLRGLGLFAEGQDAPAAEQFRTALRASSEFLPAVFYLGACYAAGGKDLEAAGAWRTSLAGAGAAPVSYRLIGEALLRANQPEEALEMLQEARGLWPGEETWQRPLGFAHALVGERSEAVAVLAPHVERRPEDLDALFVVTRILFDEHVKSPYQGEERERLARYARSYVAAGGPQQAVVGRWLQYLEGSQAP
jgi:VWFA-related protein